MVQTRISSVSFPTVLIGSSSAEHDALVTVLFMSDRSMLQRFERSRSGSGRNRWAVPNQKPEYPKYPKDPENTGKGPLESTLIFVVNGACQDVLESRTGEGEREPTPKIDAHHRDTINDTTYRPLSFHPRSHARAKISSANEEVDCIFVFEPTGMANETI